MLKIALYNLTTTTKHGGVESFIWEIARRLVDRGHAVTLFGGRGNVLRPYRDLTVLRYPYIAREVWGRVPPLRKSLNLLKLLTKDKDGQLKIDFDDVVQRSVTVVRDGEKTWPPPPVQVSAAPAAKTQGPASESIAPKKKAGLGPAGKAGLFAAGIAVLFGINAVAPAMRPMVRTRPFFRPCRSAYAPMSAAPTGRMTNPTAKMASVARRAAMGSPLGKK